MRLLFVLALSTLMTLLAKVGAGAGAAVKRVVVIGGGAAGYFSSIECARTLREHKVPATVTVLEAGRKPLSKVLISGGGRCNVMHDPMKGPNLIAKGYPRGSKELLSPLNKQFGPWETFEWFSSRLPPGATLKTEADGRVFPSTDASTTIADALTQAAQRCILSGCPTIAPSKRANPISPLFPHRFAPPGRPTQPLPLGLSLSQPALPGRRRRHPYPGTADRTPRLHATPKVPPP